MTLKDKIAKIPSVPKKVATHVYARRGRYALATGIIVGGVITRNLDESTRAEALAFIETKGLGNEFWNPLENDWTDAV